MTMVDNLSFLLHDLSPGTEAIFPPYQSYHIEKEIQAYLTEVQGEMNDRVIVTCNAYLQVNR